MLARFCLSSCAADSSEDLAKRRIISERIAVSCISFLIISEVRRSLVFLHDVRTMHGNKYHVVKQCHDNEQKDDRYEQLIELFQEIQLEDIK